MPTTYDDMGNPTSSTPDANTPTPPNNQAAPASPPKPNLYTARGNPTEFNAGMYDITNYSYPSDLMSPVYGGNYAIFYINVAVDSKLITRDATPTVEDNTPSDRGDLVGMGLSSNQLVAANVGATGVKGYIAGGLITGDMKGAPSGAVKGGVVGGVVSGVVALNAPSASRSQKRLKTAIALHIPNNLAINYGVEWSEEDTAALAMAGAVGSEVMKALQSVGKDSDVTGTGAAILTSLALSKGPQGASNSVATGMAANPKKEQVFKGVHFRTFSFEYKFFPRNSNEAQNVLNIIKEFKLHMHPEFKDSNNFVYIYPSEFDIFYYSNGKENDKIHRHTSCVLTDLAINYAPNSMFNTFDDGTPTQIDITLSFRELALLTKDKILDGL